MFLPDELVDGARPHPGAKRPSPPAVVIPNVGEDVV
jgi:hypothetical protein